MAKLFGHEAAVFTATGSLANQLGLRLLVKPGEELLAESNAHVVRAELGAAAVFSGITSRTWTDVNGKLDAANALAMARPDSGPYLVSTTAIAVENTHNFGGGCVQTLEQIKRLHTGARELGLKLHLDGARIWNAHVASGVKFDEYGKYFDTISVCLSKGLGAPIGSVLISTKENIAQARVWRKRYGGGMRQVGFLAAAGIYALKNNIPDLVRDHENAKVLAKGIAAIHSSLITIENVETNIVAIDVTQLTEDAATVSASLRAAGLLVGALGKNFIRLVTHRDVSNTEILEACEIIERVFKTYLPK